MISFGEKAKIKKGGKFELRSQLCYYNCKQVFAQKLEASNNQVQFKESEREQFTVYIYIYTV